MIRTRRELSNISGGEQGIIAVPFPEGLFLEKIFSEEKIAAETWRPDQVRAKRAPIGWDDANEQLYALVEATRVMAAGPVVIHADVDCKKLREIVATLHANPFSDPEYAMFLEGLGADPSRIQPLPEQADELMRSMFDALKDGSAVDAAIASEEHRLAGKER